MEEEQEGARSGDLEGRVGLAPEPGDQSQGLVLRARLLEAYPICLLPRHSSVVSRQASIREAWTAAEEFGQGHKEGRRGPGEGLGLRKELGRGSFSRPEWSFLSLH